MAGIQLTGISTGIDTNAIVQQLMTVESQRLVAYQNQLADQQKIQSTLSTCQQNLTSLQTAVKALSDASTLSAYTTTSSDTDILTLDASEKANEGSHTVVINQVAAPERWVHSAGIEYAEDYVGAGTFIYSYNHKETTITTAADTTLQDLVGLINNDGNNPGVTASLLYHDGKYHLVLSGDDAGSDYQISINPFNTEVLSSASALTTGGNNAVTSTLITRLDQSRGTLVGGESITIGGKKHDGTAVSQTLTVTKDTTINQLLGAINSAFGGTATATLVNGQIVLTDNACGTSQMDLSLTYNPGSGSTSLDIPAVSSSDRELWQAASSLTTGSGNAGLTNAIVDLSQLAGTLVGDESIIISGKQHDGTVVNQSFSIDGNTKLSDLIQKINDAFAGTATATLVNGKIRLTDHASGTSQMELSLTYNSGSGSTTLDLPAIRESVQGRTVTASLADFTGDDFIETQSAQDSQIKVDGYPPGADQWITRSSNTVDDVIAGVALHLHDTGTVQTSLTRDVKSLEDKLNTMVSAYNTAMSFIKDNSGYDSDTKTAGVLLTDSTVRTISDSLHTCLLRNVLGFVANVDTFLVPGHVGLEFDQNGDLSLDTTAFEDAVSKDYTGVLSLIGANQTGSSSSNKVSFYGASKYTTGGTYDVQVTVSGGAITSAKIKADGESSYRDATFAGNIVTGNSAFDTNGNPEYPENGLQLSADLSQPGTTTTTATIQVKQGFAGTMQNMLDKFLKSTNGWLTVDQQAIQQQIDGLNDRISTEQDRLSQVQSRLTTKYAKLESTLTLLKSQMAALGQSSG